jgi:hypothetical protein
VVTGEGSLTRSQLGALAFAYASRRIARRRPA